MRQGKWSFNKTRKVWEPTIKEEHVLREIVERLWLQASIKVWRIRERIPDKRKVWQHLSTPGIPDLIGYIPKHGLGASASGEVRAVFATTLYIEVKRPGGAHRYAQEQFIAEAKDGGCCAFFAESWQDVVNELAKFGIKLKGD